MTNINHDGSEQSRLFTKDVLQDDALDAVLEASHVTKVLDGEVVIDHTSFQLRAGSIHALVGPNGAGKTTLMRIISGLMRPTSGEIRAFGQPYDVEADAHLRDRIHFIGSDAPLYISFRVADVLRYARLLYSRWDERRCSILCSAFGLPLGKSVRQLSLGQKAKLRLTVALASRPDILVLDEALNGLDPAALEQALDLILQDAAERQVSVLFATHHLAEIERIADTISVFVHGRAVVTKSLDDLKGRLYEVEWDPRLTSLNWVSPEHSRRPNGIVEGRESEIRGLASRAGIGQMDVWPATLDKWFHAILEKEGVQIDKITLPQSVNL